MSKVSIGVIGAGVIGRTHADLIRQSDFCTLAGIADPSDAGRDFAAGHGAPWFSDHRAMLDGARPDAVIIATPNQLHLPVALDAIARRIPSIVEKPIAVTVEEGEALTKASEAAGVPVMIGHHRRHNPIARQAKKIVGEGALGRLTTASVLYTFYKPPGYFDLDWRRKKGGGPILINLIHEIDLIRFICGEIAAVQAITSNRERGFEVEDTAAVLLRLVNGALVTISLSDTVAAPWSWDLATRESDSYPIQPGPVQTHFISGTEGSLTLPTLELWKYGATRSWFEPISRRSVAGAPGNPYVEQLRHLCRVVRGEEKPLITPADGTRTLRATLAVHEAARTGQTVDLAQG